MPFEKNNQYGKLSKRGKNKIDKDALIDLINLCVQDLNENFDKLKTYEKIKLITAFQNIYRDSLLEPHKQMSNSLDVIYINTVQGDESKEAI